MPNSEGFLLFFGCGGFANVVAVPSQSEVVRFGVDEEVEEFFLSCSSIVSIYQLHFKVEDDM